jgi:hypothetical protein
MVVCNYSAALLLTGVFALRGYQAMRRILLTALLLALSAAALADEMSVPISDGSPAGSPLENKGVCRLSETGTEMRSRPLWTVGNISRKPIVAYVETLVVRYSSGLTTEMTRNWEFFSHPNIMGPGEEITLPDGRSPTIAPDPNGAPGNSSASVRPACEAYARWVQFLDGTVFGDPKYAEELLKVRAATYAALLHLGNVYTNQGLERFDEALHKPVQPPEVDTYIDHLRRYEKEHGVQATAEKLQLHIKIAEERSKLMH